VVVNLSAFPVVVSELGFTLSGGKPRMMTLPESLSNGASFPVRLESRSSVTAYLAPQLQWERAFEDVRRAYVETECGKRKYGTSGALKAYKNQARKRAKARKVLENA
jgi:hypothetical protein